MKQKSLLFIGLAALIIIVVVIFHGNDSPKQPAAQLPLYVALGDSVAAGQGLETASDSSACGRTNESYPFLAAISLAMQLKSYACSGAAMATGIIGKQTVNNLSIDAQANQLLSGPKPKLITLTIGANDIGWTNILGQCVTAVCGSDSDTAEVDAKLLVLKADIQQALKTIQDNFKVNTPTVMVTGYYHVFPDDSSCSNILGIEASEQQWWSAQVDKLDLTLADASSGYSFVNFTPINFSGHELCSAVPWVQGLQDRAPFHPNSDGQKIIADTIARSYEALQK